MPISDFRHMNSGIAAILLAIALLAIAITGDAGDFAISTLTYLAVFSLLLDSRDRATYPGLSQFAVYMTAMSFLLAVLCFSFLDPAKATRTLPFFFLLIFWSLQSGRAATLKRQYWKPLLLLFLLALPDRSLLMPLAYPFLYLFGWDAMTFPTAFTATFLTNLTGLTATLNHLDINMENAIVTVWQGCDGSRNMDFLLRLSIMLIVTMQIRPSRWLLTIAVAVFLAFMLNAIRVMLLAHLANNGDLGLFDYWHEGDGSKLFNLSAIILFGIFGYFQVSHRAKEDHKTLNSEQIG